MDIAILSIQHNQITWRYITSMRLCADRICAQCGKANTLRTPLILSHLQCLLPVPWKEQKKIKNKIKKNIRKKHHLVPDAARMLHHCGMFSRPQTKISTDQVLNLKERLVGSAIKRSFTVVSHSCTKYMRLFSKANNRYDYSVGRTLSDQ